MINHLTDWRADAARPFYEATPSNHGDIVMRRHITLSFREVVGVEDEVLDVHSDQVGEASSNGTLTGEGALLASLNAKRTGKMTDIVATIQGERTVSSVRTSTRRWWCRAVREPARPRSRCIARPTCCIRIVARCSVPECWWSAQLDVPPLHRPGAPLAG